MTRYTTVGLALLLSACAASKPSQQSEPSASTHTTRKPGEAKVATSPSSLLEKGGARKLQAALKRRGYEVGESGTIDRKTKEALRAFQKEQKIAATGLPDQLTIQRLDLDPKEILGGFATSKEGELDIEPRR